MREENKKKKNSSDRRKKKKGLSKLKRIMLILPEEKQDGLMTQLHKEKWLRKQLMPRNATAICPAGVM